MELHRSAGLDRKHGYGAVSWMKKREKRKRGGNPKTLKLLGGRGYQDSLVVLAEIYLESLTVRNYSKQTVQGQRQGLGFLCRWAEERELERASQITSRMLENYQRWLYRQPGRGGKQSSCQSQVQKLTVVKSFFRWACRHHHLLANPASELEMPREGYRLPAGYLSLEQLEKVFSSVNVSDPLGIRDRAILELLYSTGLRRSEVTRLEVSEINPERRTVWVRQGKGKKDRVVPIGWRALEWIKRYLEEVRPHLAGEGEKSLFVTGYGEGFNVEVLGRTVIHYLRKAGIKTGGCHLFRHTCATHMLENGADIRFIQQLLGHSDLSSTQIYTQVSIQALQEVYQRTHPAAAGALADAPSCVKVSEGEVMEKPMTGVAPDLKIS